MKFSRSILSVAFALSVVTGCKDTASNATAVTANATEKKEIAAAKHPETAVFKIDGMTCAMGCAKTIEEKLAKMDGVQKATVDFETKTATVNFDLDKLEKSDLTKAVESCADGKTYKVSGVVYDPKS